MRKIALMYKLRRRTTNIDDVVTYLFLCTPIITTLFVTVLWFASGAGGKN